MVARRTEPWVSVMVWGAEMEDAPPETAAE